MPVNTGIKAIFIFLLIVGILFATPSKTGETKNMENTLKKLNERAGQLMLFTGLSELAGSAIFIGSAIWIYIKKIKGNETKGNWMALAVALGIIGSICLVLGLIHISSYIMMGPITKMMLGR